GIGRHVASLAAGLTARGVDVTVLGPAATGQRFRFAGAFVPVAVQTGARAVPPLRRALATLRPDVIHAHGLRAGFVAGLARPQRRTPPTAGARPNRPDAVPLVVTWHNAVLASGLRGAVHRMLERRVARLADVTLGA